MLGAKPCVAFLLALWLPSSSLLAADVKIFVLAGNSNTYGQGFAAEVAPPLNMPQEDVWIWQDDLGSNVGWTASHSYAERPRKANASELPILGTKRTLKDHEVE